MATNSRTTLSSIVQKVCVCVHARAPLVSSDMQHNVHRLLAKMFNMNSQSVPPAVVTEAFVICDELFNHALVDMNQQVRAHCAAWAKCADGWR